MAGWFGSIGPWDRFPQWGDSGNTNSDSRTVSRYYCYDARIWVGCRVFGHVKGVMIAVFCEAMFLPDVVEGLMGQLFT